MRCGSVRGFPVLAQHRVQNAFLNVAPPPPQKFVASPEILRHKGYETEGDDGEISLGLEHESTTTRRSQPAKDGSARIGMVELPVELQMAVNRLIEGEFIWSRRKRCSKN